MKGEARYLNPKLLEPGLSQPGLTGCSHSTNLDAAMNGKARPLPVQPALGFLRIPPFKGFFAI